MKTPHQILFDAAHAWNELRTPIERFKEAIRQPSTTHTGNWNFLAGYYLSLIILAMPDIMTTGEAMRIIMACKALVCDPSIKEPTRVIVRA